MNQLFCLEVIDHNSVRIFTDIDEARLWLNQRIAPIRLDYHGVLDLVPPGSVLPTDGPMCVISYVGLLSPLRSVVRQDIQLRIRLGQIAFGVLVFQKGCRQTKNKYWAPGGKAWVNQQLARSGTCLFLDDSNEHIRSTQSMPGCDHVLAELCNSGSGSTDAFMALLRKRSSKII